jgi:hypothetical protein
MQDIQALSYSRRVAYGKSIENKIMEIMNAHGYRVIPASLHEDIHQKIDAYLKLGNRWYSLQIKYRQTREAIPLEVVHLEYRNGRPKELTSNMLLDGRDMKGCVEMYACLIGETVWIYPKTEVVQKATKITRQLLDKHIKNKHANTIRDYGITAQITLDPRTKHKKVMVWILPTCLDDCLEISLKNQISSSFLFNR